jgi:glutamate synthase (ferredoxin)
MTGGRVVVLGHVGRNFGAGMSGGVAYLYDVDGTSASHVNQAMVDVEPLLETAEFEIVKTLITNHAIYTDSEIARSILAQWDTARLHFKRVVPRDYRRVLDALDAAKKRGLNDDEAAMDAFEANKSDKARVAGN